MDNIFFIEQGFLKNHISDFGIPSIRYIYLRDKNGRIVDSIIYEYTEDMNRFFDKYKDCTIHRTDGSKFSV